MKRSSETTVIAEENAKSNKQYRMVALDLDGTLLGSDHRISEASIKHLRRLHESGFIISIATGRSMYAVTEVISDLNLQFTDNHHLGGFPVVCVNGAMGVQMFSTSQNDDKNNISGDSPKRHHHPILNGTLKVTELFHHPVSRDLTIKTLQIAKGLGCVTNYYIEHDVYAHPRTEWHYSITKRYSDLTGVVFTYKKDEYKEAMERSLPSKLLVLCEPQDIDVTFKALSESLNEGGMEATVIRGSPPFFVEILNKDVCKGNGLEEMCNVLGLDLQECISFGDGDNDVEFLQMSGLGLAMKNARDHVKAIADDVTEWTNVQDGVIRTLQNLEEKGLLRLEKDV